MDLHAVLVLVLSLVATTTGYCRKMILVSMDGFRWDYLNGMHGYLPNFERMIREGARAPYLKNTYATMTFPTHYSIATGLYQESHGIIGNEMYDPVWKESFWMGNNDPKWWNAGEPMWITATKNGLRSGCVYFPGSEVEIEGVRPDFWLSFNSSAPFRSRVDQIIRWFVDENLDLGILYFNEPDRAGHTYGPRSPQVREKVQELDNVLGYLLDEMEANGLKESVNLIVTADHGMTDIPEGQIVNVLDYISMDQLEYFVDLGTQCHLFPKAGLEEEVYTALENAHPHMDVFRKSGIEPEWHYKNNRRVPPVLISMDIGWTCTKDPSAPWLSQKGNHGYDNRVVDMRPIFLASGPDIKRNFSSDVFESVDIYPLVCEVLQIPPSPNNGTLAEVAPMLRQESKALPLVDGCPVLGTFYSLWMAIAVLTASTY